MWLGLGSQNIDVAIGHASVHSRKHFATMGESTWCRRRTGITWDLMAFNHSSPLGSSSEGPLLEQDARLLNILKNQGKLPKVQKHSTKLENIRKHYKNFKIILPHFVVCQHPCTQHTIFSLHHRSLVLPTFSTAAPNTSKKKTQFNQKKKIRQK